MSPSSPYATPPSVLAQITALPDLPMADIKALWQELFDEEPPTHNRQFLERRIAYRLQEIAFCKVDRHLMDRNKRRIQAILETGRNTQDNRDTPLMAGTVLVREHQEREHRVMVLPDGQFEYEGRPYRSLSRIAREITGTAWSGPVFFGLKTQAKAKDKKKGARV